MAGAQSDLEPNTSPSRVYLGFVLISVPSSNLVYLPSLNPDDKRQLHVVTRHQPFRAHNHPSVV